MRATRRKAWIGMRITSDRVGPRGLALIAVTAIVAAVLAVHGWSGRHSGMTPGALAGAGSHSAAPAASSPSAGPSSSPGTGSAASPSASAGAGAGPLLSSQSYASYAFRVWPGTPSSAARTAMTGLSISVHRQGSGISVAAGVTGQAKPAAHLYPSGAQVYVVEAALGDDSGNSDYNLGDDGLVVTDAQGRIVQ